MDNSTTQDDRVIEDISRKIDREKVLIQGARALRNSTSNALVQQKCDTNIHEGQKNIEYLQERLKQLQIRKRISVSGESTGSGLASSANSSSTLPGSTISPFNSSFTSHSNSTQNGVLPSMCQINFSGVDFFLIF